MYSFPEVPFDAARFNSAPTKNWKDPATTKTFFDQFAQGKLFDALNPENWYLITSDVVTQTKV
jgi:hypothetical protein